MPARLAAQVAALTPEDLATFIRALPRLACLALCAFAEDRLAEERLAALPRPVPVVVNGAAHDPDEVLNAADAAHVLKMHVDTLYERVESGELVPLEPHVKGRRYRFRRGDLLAPPVARGLDRRYTPTHDTPRRTSPPPPARLDATRTRRRPECDRDDGGPLGTRGARRHAPRHGDPYAPSQATWRDRPEPPKGGST